MKTIACLFLGLFLLSPAAFSKHSAAEPVLFAGDPVESEPARDASDGEEAGSPEELPEETGDNAAETDTVPEPIQDTRSVAERTGAVHYAPAMGTECGDSEWEIGEGIRFELGVRCLGLWLTEDRQGEPFNGSYIGSIYKLKAKQNLAPIHPYVQMKFAVGGGFWMGLGAAYSHFEVETLDDGGGDGDIVTDAALAYLLLERPIGRRVRPYAEVGGGMAFNSFDAIGSWDAGGLRRFELEDSPVFLAAGGCAFGLTEHFSLDAHVRYLHCEVDGTYVYRGDARPDTDFTFPVSQIAAGIGASYVF